MDLLLCIAPQDTDFSRLIAIMLGRFRMTVPDCIHEYEKLGARIFGKPRRFCELNFPVLTERTKYDAKRLHEVFLDVTRERREDSEDARQLSVARFPSRQGVCKTYVRYYLFAKRGPLGRC